MNPQPCVRRRAAPAARIATLALGGIGLVVALATAAAADGDVSNISLPNNILLVGHDGAGQPDPAGQIQVTVRDLANNLVAGSLVEIDFTRCADIRIAASQPDPGLSVDCALHRVRAISDANGIARFRIVGGALNPGGAPGGGFWNGAFYVDGGFAGFRTVAAFDQNGLNGLDGGDLAAWVTDYFGAAPVGRSDYDGSGGIGGNDAAIWARAYFANGSRFGAGSLPGGLCP